MAEHIDVVAHARMDETSKAETMRQLSELYALLEKAKALADALAAQLGSLSKVSIDGRAIGKASRDTRVKKGDTTP